MFSEIAPSSGFVVGVAFLFGLIIGSFLNVVIHRVPLGESIVTPRSRCPHCGYQIAWYENVPLASYLALRGRCRKCAAPISPRYFLVELMTGTGFAMLVAKFGWGVEFAKFAIFIAFLIPLAFIDLDIRRLPDVLTKSGLAVGLLFSTIVPVSDGTAALLARLLNLAPVSPRVLSLIDGVMGAILAAGILWFIAWAYWVLRHREGMGFGDVKLMAFVGSFLGWQLAWLTIFLASVVGTVFSLPIWVYFVFRRVRNDARSKRKRTSKQRLSRILVGPLHFTMARYQVPFGTALAATAVFSAVVGKDILHWYASLAF